MSTSHSSGHRRRTGWRRLGAGFLLMPWLLPAAPAGEVRVAVAANVSAAVSAMARSFRARTGDTVKMSVGSSGNLTRQIINGAPFEVFLSANEQYVERLAAASLTEGDGVVYARGRLALFVPRRSSVRLTADLSTLAGDVAAGRLKRLALPNPMHAPYGIIAEAALEASGASEAVAPAIVLGANAAQTAQFAVSGSVDAALVPYSLVRVARVRAQGRSVLVSERLYPRLRQRMVLLRGAGGTARAFYRYARTADARRILERNGFMLPDAATADRSRD